MQFPGNIIPSNMLNASSLKNLDRFYPKANFGDPLVPSLNLNVNYVQKLDEPTYVGRVDQRFGDKLTLYYRYLFNHQTVRQNDNGLPASFLGNSQKRSGHPQPRPGRHLRVLAHTG